MHSSKLIAAVVALLALTSACREAPRPVAAASLSSSIAVPVAPVATQEWPTIYEAVGTVRARSSVVMASKVMGYVRDLKFKLGDSVKPGEVLVRLDSRDLDAAYRQAQAARQEAESASAEASNTIASAQANLELAQATFRRMQDLFDKKSISNQEYDEAAARLKLAQAAHDAATSRRAQVQAKIQQTEEAVSATDVMRGYTEIRAPFGGVITEKQVELGTLATPGAPLFTIEQSGALRLEVAVEEAQLAATRVGQPVTVQLDALSRTIAGQVSEIVPVLDPAARAITVKIDLPGMPQLRPGMYGRAQFARGMRRVVAVPASAVSSFGQVQSVMVVEEGIARTRLVTTGQHQGEWVEILSGLSAGERVVAPRPAGLADGAHVETQQ
jgi:RND family efflux transporter MFP subunit